MHFFGNFWAILATWILICILHADLDPSVLLSDLTPHHCFLDGNINLIMYVWLKGESEVLEKFEIYSFKNLSLNKW